MKKRWFIYIIVGILFGIFDFYYQEFTGGGITSNFIWFIVAWGIWLIPIIPIAIYEAKVTESRLRSQRPYCSCSVGHHSYISQQYCYVKYILQIAGG